MSAPAMNAFSPEPVRITPRTVSSSRASSNAVLRSFQVAPFNAFKTFGRLSVMYAMPFFFSYRRFSSVIVAPVVMTRSSPFSNEGAEAGDGLADDQVLHLEGAFVGVDRFRIREEARDVVVDQDPVAAHELAGPRDGLAPLRRAERLDDRRLRVRQLVFGFEVNRADQHALAGDDVGEHLCQQLLDELERPDRLAELQALLGILDGVL